MISVSPVGNGPVDRRQSDYRQATFGDGILYPYHPWDWYIYLHGWLDVYGKCREIYQSHGCYGIENLANIDIYIYIYQ